MYLAYNFEWYYFTRKLYLLKVKNDVALGITKRLTFGELKRRRNTMLKGPN